MSHGLSQAMRTKMQLRLASCTAASTSHSSKLATEDLSSFESEDLDSSNKTLNDLSLSSTQAPSEHPSVFSLDFNMEMNKMSLGSSIASSERPSLGSLDFRDASELARESTSGSAERPSLWSLNYKDVADFLQGSEQGTAEESSLRTLVCRVEPYKSPLAASHPPSACLYHPSSSDGATSDDSSSTKGSASLLGATVRAYPARSFNKQIGTVTSVEGGCLTVEFDNTKFGKITLLEGRSVEVQRKLTERELVHRQVQRGQARRSLLATPRHQGAITIGQFFAMCKAQNLECTGTPDDVESADGQHAGLLAET